MHKIVNGEQIELTEEEITQILSDWEKGDERIEARKYIYNRRYEYPSIEDQLDLIYHEGIDVWKDTIKKIKDKYPKI